MRQPNYRIGWYIPYQVAALTHFHPDVTIEDFTGVVQDGQELLRQVSNEFSIIIDNRVVGMSTLASLRQMRQMVPYMSHPLLRWVVVIKPEHLALDTDALPIEAEATTQLKNVSSVEQALRYLQQVTEDVQWQQANVTFFPKLEGR